MTAMFALIRARSGREGGAPSGMLEPRPRWRWRRRSLVCTRWMAPPGDPSAGRLRAMNGDSVPPSGTESPKFLGRAPAGAPATRSRDPLRRHAQATRSGDPLRRPVTSARGHVHVLQLGVGLERVRPELAPD